MTGVSATTPDIQHGTGSAGIRGGKVCPGPALERILRFPQMSSQYDQNGSRQRKADRVRRIAGTQNKRLPSGSPFFGFEAGRASRSAHPQKRRRKAEPSGSQAKKSFIKILFR